MFVLTKVNVDKDILETRLFNNLKNAQSAMMIDYNKDYDELIKNHDECKVGNNSWFGDETAVLGYSALANATRWDISAIEVED